MDNMPATPSAIANSSSQLRTRKLARKLFNSSFSVASFFLISSNWLTTINPPTATLISNCITCALLIILFVEARELYRRLS